MPRRSKRQDRLCEERNASIKPIPKDDEHRIYYKKTRSTIEVICSLTGKQDTFYRHEDDDPYSQKRIMQQDPAHNDYGKCPVCGKYGKFVSPGRAKQKDVDTKYYTFYNQWEEDGLVARHIEVWRRYYNQYSDCKGPKAYREEVTEYARTYLKIGQEAQTDFCKIDYYSDREFWDYKNLYGYANIKVIDESAKELNILLLRRAPWKYTLDVYDQINGSRGVNKTKLAFLKRYVQYPEIEIMFKTGMYQLAANLINGWKIKRYKGKHIWDQYGITKEHWDYIREHDLGIGVTKAFQKNDMCGYGCTADQIQWLYNNIHLELEDIQWYEANDKKPHKKTIQPWLDAYVEHLKEKKHGTNGTELAAG